jgi:hypothetical protein
MANGQNPNAEKFARQLRGHLERRDLAVHALARRIADNRVGGHASRKLLEQVRRDLNRYLTGRFNPGPKKRREIAVALGLEPDELQEDDLSPEGYAFVMTGKPLADVGQQLVDDLMREARTRVRKARRIQKALA